MLKFVSHLLHVIVWAIQTKQQDSKNQLCIWNGAGVVWSIPALKHDKTQKSSKFP